MLNNNFSPQELTDTLGTFEAGMNSDPAPLLLKKNQMALAVNITVRGAYARPRPPFQLLELSSESKTLISNALSVGPFQAAAFYNPDFGDECLTIAIAGRLF